MKLNKNSKDIWKNFCEGTFGTLYIDVSLLSFDKKSWHFVFYLHQRKCDKKRSVLRIFFFAKWWDDAYQLILSTIIIIFLANKELTKESTHRPLFYQRVLIWLSYTSQNITYIRGSEKKKKYFTHFVFFKMVR